MNASCDLSIIIVAWNVRDLVLDCLASIRDARLAISNEVLVVDNGSHDGTVEAVRRQFSETHVIALPENVGFAAGNNQGLLKMNGRYAVLLNSDTIVLRGGLEHCVGYLDAHPDVGVVGPQLLNPDRTKQNCIHNTPSLVSEVVSQSLLRRLFPGRYPSKRVEYREPIEVDAVLGACLFVRRDVVQEVGPIDEAYFFFLEETDWCHQIRERGWKVVHLPDAQVIHLYGESTKKKVPLQTRIEYYRSRYTFFRKNRTRAAYVGLRLLVGAKLLLGSIFGGRRAAEYRGILRWHVAGRPAKAGLRSVSGHEVAA
ncbi:MAG: glycosyltransferase family 2 protein [Myxococcota bacterium]